MTMFGSSAFSSSTNTYSWSTGVINPMKDIEVQAPPDDTISSLAWSPTGLFLVAGSWNNSVSCNSTPRSNYIGVRLLSTLKKTYLIMRVCPTYESALVCSMN